MLIRGFVSYPESGRYLNLRLRLKDWDNYLYNYRESTQMGLQLLVRCSIYRRKEIHHYQTLWAVEGIEREVTRVKNCFLVIMRMRSGAISLLGSTWPKE